MSSCALNAVTDCEPCPLLPRMRRQAKLSTATLNAERATRSSRSFAVSPDLCHPNLMQPPLAFNGIVSTDFKLTARCTMI